MRLGFDASTTTVGYSFFDESTNKVQDCGFIDISKLKTNKEKVLYVIDILKNHPLITKIDKINLEAALSGFAGGFTSQQVIIKLARFNALFEYIIGEYWKLPINLISANTARKKVLGKSFVKGIKPKEYVRQELPKKYPEVVNFNKLNKNNEWNIKNYDMYDAVIISCV